MRVFLELRSGHCGVRIFRCVSSLYCGFIWWFHFICVLCFVFCGAAVLVGIFFYSSFCFSFVCSNFSFLFQGSHYFGIVHVCVTSRRFSCAPFTFSSLPHPLSPIHEQPILNSPLGQVQGANLAQATLVGVLERPLPPFLHAFILHICVSVWTDKGAMGSSATYETPTR